MHAISRTVILGTALLAACEGPADSRVQATPDPVRQSLAVDTPPVARCMKQLTPEMLAQCAAWGHVPETGGDLPRARVGTNNWLL